MWASRLQPTIERDHVIIGGSTRSGSTALFKYLSSHNDVCASSLKETRFFLDKDYPGQRYVTIDDASLEVYFGYFCECDRRIRLEASPDYLYGEETPVKVRASLKDVKWLFILREPIDRIRSWHTWGIQVGLLPKTLSLDEYVTRMLDSVSEAGTNQAYRALQQGRYSEFLGRFRKEFGQESILLLSYGMLKARPLDLMMSVCSFLEISSEPFKNYQFGQINQSHGFRHAAIQRTYIWLQRKLYMLVYDKPALRLAMRFLERRIASPLYSKLNVVPRKDQELPNEILDRLQGYYKDELARLRDLAGHEFAW